MTRLRRLLGPIAATWILCQVAGLTAAPVIVWITAPELECTCGHGPHAMCPMHHRSASGCSVAAAQGDAAVLSSLLIGTGILAPASTAIAPAPITAVVRSDRTIVSFRPTTPDPPPPRA